MWSVANKNNKNNKKTNIADILWLQKTYITENKLEKFWIKKKTQNLMKNISESEFKVIHAIRSLDIHHNFS